MLNVTGITAVGSVPSVTVTSPNVIAGTSVASSKIVTVAGLDVVALSAVPTAVKLSVASSMLSSTIVNVTSPSVSPAGIVTVNTVST
ncbi:hypothetical protein L2Z00_11965 [Tenacibaculum sp. MSW2]|nr:hypothetical protein [Tenacibaculum aquimarinum]MCH3885541.1 hypothetical protein [Tenacibaculum aquimarinum]